MCFEVTSNSSILSTSSLSNVILEFTRVMANIFSPPLEKDAFTVVGNTAFKICSAGTLLIVFIIRLNC